MMFAFAPLARVVATSSRRIVHLADSRQLDERAPHPVHQVMFDQQMPKAVQALIQIRQCTATIASGKELWALMTWRISGPILLPCRGRVAKTSVVNLEREPNKVSI